MTTISKHCLILQLIIVLLLQWMQTSCAGHVDVNATKGNITTQNYPSYVTNHDGFSTWTINVDSGKRIRLEIKDLILPNCVSACTCDLLEIHDIIAHAHLAVLCSTISTPKVYYSSGRTVDLTLFSTDTDVASRRFWIYYESYQSATTSTASTPIRKARSSRSSTTLFTAVPTSRPSKGGNQSSIDNTVLVTGVVVSVMLLLILCFVCRLKLKFSRRRQNPQTRQSVSLPADEEISIPGPPPSYDEAMQSSRTSLTNLSNNFAPNSSLSLDNIDFTDVVTPENENETHASEPCAYDATGLPSYRESQRLSQTSLNQDNFITMSL